MSAKDWTGFVDPYERAFTAEMPVGWLTFGGNVRHDPNSPSGGGRVPRPGVRLGQPGIGTQMMTKLPPE